jgi:hypothetical protein
MEFEILKNILWLSEPDKGRDKLKDQVLVVQSGKATMWHFHI